MDWKLLFSTFGLVFLAELGDKTQLATMSLATSGTSRWAVFLGSSLALILTSAIAVLVGGELTRLVPAIWIQRIAGLGFLVMGVLFLVGKG
jgi:putative Ca2+/H+ antiporter (TMEM165/GDT1 family)